MLLRSRCGENCRCEKAHHIDSIRRTRSRGSFCSHQSSGDLSVSVESSTKASVQSNTKTLISFSPVEFSTPIASQGSPTFSAADISLTSLGSAGTTDQQPVSILKSSEKKGGTELRSTKQVHFGKCTLQNGGSRRGSLYSDSEESVDGEAPSSSWHHQLQQQQGIPNGVPNGKDSVKTVTTATTGTLIAKMLQESFSDTDDEYLAEHHRGNRQWLPPQRPVFLIGNDTGASPHLRSTPLYWRQQQQEQEAHRPQLLLVMASGTDAHYIPQHQGMSLTRAVGRLLVGLWKFVYLATALYILAERYVFQRGLPQRRKRFAVALFFLIMVPLLLWLLHEEQGLNSHTLQSAGSCVYKVLSATYLSSALSWLLRSSATPLAPFVELVLPTDHASAASKQVPHPELLSEERLRGMVESVVKGLALQIPYPGKQDDKVMENTKEDLGQLRQELERHKTMVEQVLLQMDNLKNCCQDVATLLAGLDSKIIAKVLEVMNSSSSATAPRNVLYQWLSEEMDQREAIFGANIEALLGKQRDSMVIAATTASQHAAQAQRMAVEAHRKAEQAVAVARHAAVIVPATTHTSVRAMDDVTRVVKEMLAKYDADKTGLPDYALESAGGSVVNTRCTETYSSGGRRYYLFGLPIWTFTRSPRDAITPGMHPGECWAFRGSQGHLVVKLSQRVLVTAVSVEHIARSLVSSGHTTSAPRDFQIWGLESETDSSGRLLGSYTYDADGDPLQYFITQTPEPTLYVEMKILSNHGNLDYTCLYRLRIHGEPAS